MDIYCDNLLVSVFEFRFVTREKNILNKSL